MFFINFKLFGALLELLINVSTPLNVSSLVNILILDNWNLTETTIERVNTSTFVYKSNVRGFISFRIEQFSLLLS